MVAVTGEVYLDQLPGVSLASVEVALTFIVISNGPNAITIIAIHLQLTATAI